MIGKSLGLHIIQFPSKKWGYVGSVPRALGDPVEATKSDVMSGRAYRAGDGRLMTLRFPAFDTREEAEAFAETRGVTARRS